VRDGAAASQPLRSGLLEDVGALLVSADVPSESLEAVRELFPALGASVAACTADARARAEEHAMDELALSALAGRPGLDLLVVDGGGMFAAGAVGAGAVGGAALRECLQGVWNATRAVVNRVLLQQDSGGRLVLLAPAAGAGEHAAAARAGLENLARTLSVEWARHGLTAVAVGAGEQTPPGELAALVAYIASPAGAYLSGCLLEPR